MQVADGPGEYVYRGQDRRDVGRRGAVSLDRRRAARDGLLLVCAVVAALAMAQLLHAGTVDASARLALGIAASVAATLAGFAALMRHRLAGDAPLAYLGLGLLAYGASVAPLTAIVGQLDAPAAAGGLESLRLAAVVAVVLLFAGGLMVSEVDTSITSRRLAWVSLAGVTGLAVALEASSRMWGVALNDVTTRAMVPLWFAVACGYLAAGLRRRRAALWRVGGGLLVITVAHVVRALDASPGDVVALSLAAIRLVGAGAVVLGVVPDVLAALAARRLAEATMRDWWTTSEAERLRILREVSERRHEMTNALVGIAGANFALDPDSPLLDREDAALLRRAVQQEVERLQLLIAQEGPPVPDRAFLVRDVIRPLVAARRALGERVTFTGDTAVAAFGSPEALGQILVNLLTNCARHAPGGHVEVTAGRAGGRVLVHVVDDGPRTALPTSAGSGIGLAVSSRLAQQHGGCLRLLTRAPGVRGFGIALELPAPPSPYDDLVSAAPEALDHPPTSPICLSVT